MDWEKVEKALGHAHEYMITSKDQAPQKFVNKNMRTLIRILLEQIPEENQPDEGFECITHSILLVKEDLRAKKNIIVGDCMTLDVLLCIFDEENEENGSYLKSISLFKKEKGFSHLAAYLSSRASTCKFPPLDIVHALLKLAFKEVMHSKGKSLILGVQSYSEEKMEKDTVLMLKAVTRHLATHGYSLLGCNSKTWSLNDFHDNLQKMREHFFGPVLPPLPTSHLQTTSVEPTLPTSVQHEMTQDTPTHIDAAKQRLLSAQRWKESTGKSLELVQSEHALSTKEVEDAHSYLAELENSEDIETTPAQKKRRGGSRSKTK